jgi:hypothetical protein
LWISATANFIFCVLDAGHSVQVPELSGDQTELDGMDEGIDSGILSLSPT